MIRLATKLTLADTLFPYTTLLRSLRRAAVAHTLPDKNDRALRRHQHVGRRRNALRISAAATGDVGVAILGPRRFFRYRLVEYVERSEEHTSDLQSLIRISYAAFCLKKQTKPNRTMPDIMTSP